MLRIYVAASLAANEWVDQRVEAFDARQDRGQATAEYVLLMLGAAALALLVLAWATKTTKIGSLLNKVIDALIAKVT